MTSSGIETTRFGAQLHTGPFHTALRTAIRQRGLTLERLRVHLARRGISVGLSSLSNWQNGHSRPETAASLQAITALEDILGVPPRSLVRLATASIEMRGQGANTGVVDIGAVAEMLATLSVSHDQDLELISLQHKVVVDSARKAASTWTRTAVRALRDGVDRYVARYYGSPNCTPALVRTNPLGNCRLGRFVPHATAPALVYELVFDHVLRAGDTWVFESELVDPDASECDVFASAFRSPTEQYLLEVRFHPSARPATCYSFAQRDLNDERHPTGHLTLNPHNSVHLVASAVSSGVLGIGWEWPE